MAITNRLKQEQQEKMNAMCAAQASTSLGGLVGEEYREPTLRERLLNEKARIQRDASSKIRKINNSLTEIENTEAEDVVRRAREVLEDVG